MKADPHPLLGFPGCSASHALYPCLSSRTGSGVVDDPAEEISLACDGAGLLLLLAGVMCVFFVLVISIRGVKPVRASTAREAVLGADT